MGVRVKVSGLVSLAEEANYQTVKDCIIAPSARPAYYCLAKPLQHVQSMVIQVSGGLGCNPLVAMNRTTSRASGKQKHLNVLITNNKTD